MKRLSIPIYLLLHSCLTNAQIPTPPFTRYRTCPDNFSQVNRCIGWRQPGPGTSDYFNVCAAGTNVGIPQNIFGFQDSPDGAYAGLYTYLPSYREYIGTRIAPLIVGHTYTMTITVSLADSSRYATDGLGVFFSTYSFNDPWTGGTLHVTPQVDYSSYGIITDKVNWVTLSKTFVADSAYTSLVVGCFKSDSVIQIDTFESGQIQGKPAAYYYISRIGIPDSLTTDTTTAPPDPKKYFFPTGFTPNGDGANDIFKIVIGTLFEFEKYSLCVFNRFGQRIFFTEDATTGWDGTFNDVPQEIGTYFYMAKFSANGKEILSKGDVTLIR